MGVFTKMASMLTWSRTEESGRTPGEVAGRAGPRVPRANGMIHPESPVGVEVAREGAEGGRSGGESGGVDEEGGQIERAQSPRNKQELVAELQKNYVEVLELVRRVNSHLDRQEERSDRIMKIVDRLPDAIDSLAATREQNGALLAAMNESTAASKAGNERVASVVEDLARHGERQAGALGSINEGLEKSRRTELQLVQTMAEFRTSVSEMAGSSSRVGDTLESLQNSSAARERELVDLVNESRRWTLTAMIACGAGVGIALALAMVALFSTGA